MSITRPRAFVVDRRPCSVRRLESARVGTVKTGAFLCVNSWGPDWGAGDLEPAVRIALDAFPEDWSYYTLTYPVARYKHLSMDRIMQEMIALIIGQRAYEANSKAIQAADEMLQQANNVRR